MILPPLRRFLFHTHSIAGLVVSLVLALMGLTGALLAFEDEIAEALNASIAHVAPRAEATLGPAGILAGASRQTAHRITSISFERQAGAAVLVRFARAADGGRPTAVYLDPYDGHVMAPARGDDAFALIRRLHRWLLLPGDGRGAGRSITGAVVLSLLVLLVSGIVLRWPRKATSLRLWLKPQLGLRGRGLTRSLHTVIGTWLLPVYFLSALTGLWWSYDWYQAGAKWLLSSKATPAKATAAAPALPKVKMPGTDTEIDPAMLDGIWLTFLANGGAGHARATLTFPEGGGERIIRIRSVGRDAPHAYARDEFRFDGHSGRLLSAERYAAMSSGDKLLTSVFALHSGRYFGPIGSLLFVLAAAMMPLFAFTGWMLYLSRLPRRPTVKGAEVVPAPK